MKDNNIEDIYELSPMQQGMLFHTLYESESGAGAYFEQLICTLEVPPLPELGEGLGVRALNVWAFKQAWQQVVTRHPILRSAFYWEELEEPLQIVNRQVVLPWVEYDWRGGTPTVQEERLQAFLAADQEQGFELDEAPLMRFALIRVTEQRYELVWSHHHILFDGWSMPIILKEVLTFYEAYHQGDTSRLHLTRPRPYRDYIAWLQEQDIAQAKAFWQQRLKGFAAPTPLASTDNSPSPKVGRRASGWGVRAQQKASYAEVSLNLSASASSLHAQLQALARQHHLTLNNLVQGAWALLLSRYSGEADVLFGATVSGRSIPLFGVESMVGLFINTLPVRAHISDSAHLLPWLKTLQAQHVEQEQYAYLSLAETQQTSDLPPGMPLFESLLVFENYPLGPPSIPPNARGEARSQPFLKIRALRGFERTNYPLTLVVNPNADYFSRLIYDTSRFDEATIRRMMGHFQTLLEQMVAKKEGTLAELSMLTAAERHQLLVEWNETQTEYPKEKCIHQLFEEQVARTPDTIALVFGDQQLTYRQLNERANQLTHHLQSLGVGAETLVGICVERSIEMVVGILAILKAGGAYVPLDPTYPPERLAFMLEDAHVSVLLTEHSLIETLPTKGAEGHPVQMVCLDTDWPTIAAFSQANPANRVKPNHLAYVIYTSGSTGNPKGVLVPHLAVNRLVNNTDYIDIRPTDRIAQASNASFDAATFEIWGALLNGARLVGISHDILLSPQRLAAKLRSEQITILFLTTALFNQVVTLAPNAFDSLRCLLFGGEAVDPVSVRKLLEYGPPENFGHVYGPTENTTFSSWYVIQSVSKDATTVPIGKPIANSQIYILDTQLEPVPIGMVGQLYVGGDGLAQGYLNRRQLTEERFIPHPFATGRSGDARLYKTGDLARWLPDGNIEFLGRIDHQVKIRGFRIELGEIEVVLTTHPQVQQAVVIARKEHHGKQLVAYIVASTQELVPNVLRDFLKEKLPEYMIPAVFVLLEKLPLTPNGKVDRKALPAPEPLLRTPEVAVVAPRNETEEILAAIWAEVLGIEPPEQHNISIHDNFFELGGHSLLATQVISRVRESFSIELPLRDLFECPTIAELTERVAAQQLAQAESDLLAQILSEVDGLSDDSVIKQLLA